MLIKTACQQCSSEFVAASFSARYCTPQCKQRAYRERRAAAQVEAEPSPEPVTHESSPTSQDGFVAAATRAELRTIGREGSAVGLAAVALAHRIDRGDDDSAGGLAAIVREHARALDRALMVAGASVPSPDRGDADDSGDGDDPVIRLQEARERRRRRQAER